MPAFFRPTVVLLSDMIHYFNLKTHVGNWHRCLLLIGSLVYEVLVSSGLRTFYSLVLIPRTTLNFLSQYLPVMFR